MRGLKEINNTIVIDDAWVSYIDPINDWVETDAISITIIIIDEEEAVKILSKYLLDFRSDAELSQAYPSQIEP